jgi:hypothetical protein
VSLPLAPISLDLDDKWSYLMTHGHPSWTSYPSYLQKLIPRILEFLAARDLKVTFFVVGRDASIGAHDDILSELARQGHRIGNHSFDHKPWLHRFSDVEIADELERSEAAIERATGVLPRGFRGPGFSLTNEVLRQLANRGYLYDATAFPNILNPLSRAYYFRTTNLSSEEREVRAELFGTLGAAFRPNKPYTWRMESGATMTEVPVTTFPGLRTPIHLSYLAYLGGKALPVASAYFRTALTLCRLTGNPPSMLLHPLDFLGSEDEDDLGFFPGMDLASGKKLELAHHFLDQLQGSYALAPIDDYLSAISTRKERVADYSA